MAWYRIPEGAAGWVEENQAPLLVIAIDQDGKESQHVLWLEEGEVRSALAEEYTGEQPQMRWEGQGNASSLDETGTRQQTRLP